MKRAAWMLAVLALVLGGTGQVKADLITNGGFETGNLTGWTLSPGGPFDQVVTAGESIGAGTGVVHSGTYAMSFGLNGAVDTLSQNLSTVAGQQYTLTFFLANQNPDNQGVTTFQVKWDGNVVYSLLSPQGSFDYTEVVIPNLIATTNSTSLQFLAQQDPSQWFLDDVSVNAVPEPATLAVFGVLAAGAFGLRRRLKAAPTA